MYNNFSSKKTKKVISALLASALVVTSAPITANAATAKVLGVGKTFTVKKTTKVSGLSKAEKKIVKVTVNKKKRTVTVKGVKAGKATFKIGKKAYTVKVGATSITKKSVTTSMTAGQKKTLSVNAVNGKGDTITFTSNKKGVVKVNKASAKANAKKVASTTVTAVAEGTAKITAKSKYTGKSKTFTIKVVAATPAPTQAPSVATTPAITTPSATPGVATTPAVKVTATPGTDASATPGTDATATPGADVTATPGADVTQAPGTDATATPGTDATQNPDATQVPDVPVAAKGNVAVTTNVSGASIKVLSGTSVIAEKTLEGEDLSATLTDIENGTYTIQVSKPGYGNFTDVITIAGNTVDVKADIELVTLKSAKATSETRLQLNFNGEIDLETVKIENFKVSGVTVTSAKLTEDKTSVILETTTMTKDEKYTVSAANLTSNGVAVASAETEFVGKEINYELKLTLADDKNSLTSNGQDSVLVTAQLFDEDGAEVKDLDKVEIKFTTTAGSFAENKVTVQNGVATNMLTSEISTTEIKALITATVVSATNKNLLNVTASKSVVMSPSVAQDADDEKVGASLVDIAVETNDRIVLYFNKEVNVEDFTMQDSTDGGNGVYTYDPSKLVLKIDDNAKNSDTDPASNDRVVRALAPVENNKKALVAILEVDGATANRVPLTDNAKVIVNATDKRSNLVSVSKSASTLVSEIRIPSILGVENDGLNKIKVTFSEPVQTKNGAIGAGLDTKYVADDASHWVIDGTVLTSPKWGAAGHEAKVTVGEFDINTGVDTRNVVTIELGQTSANKQIYFVAGKHSVQGNKIGDWANVTDRNNNIVNTATLDFSIAPDETVPSAEVTVESPEQYFVTFNKAVSKSDVINNLALQQYDKTSAQWVNKFADASAVGDLAGIDGIKITALNETSDHLAKEYLVELKKDWTYILNTKATKENYYNNSYRLHIKAGTIENPGNGLKNVEQNLLLDDEIMTKPDTVSPEIKINGVEQVGTTNSYQITMSEPVQIPNLAGEVITPSQTQSNDDVTPNPDGVPRVTVTFISEDNTVTVPATIDRMIANSHDTSFVVKPSDTLTAGKWRVVVASISDDVGNTSSTLIVKDFEVKTVTAVDTGFKVLWVVGVPDGKKEPITGNSTTISGEDVVYVKFNKPFKTYGASTNAISTINYNINNYSIPTDSQIDVSLDGYNEKANVKNGYTDLVAIHLKSGTLNKKASESNTVTINSTIEALAGGALSNGGLRVLNYVEPDDLTGGSVANNEYYAWNFGTYTNDKTGLGSGVTIDASDVQKALDNSEYAAYDFKSTMTLSSQTLTINNAATTNLKITHAGTYDFTGQSVSFKSLTINTEETGNIIVKGLKVTGDVNVTAPNAEVKLLNGSVGGNTNVKDVLNSSLTLDTMTITGKIIVTDESKGSRIVISGGTNGGVYINTTDEVMLKGATNVEVVKSASIVFESAPTTLKLTGTAAANVKLIAANSNVNLGGLSINNTTGNTEIKVEDKTYGESLDVAMNSITASGYTLYETYVAENSPSNVLLPSETWTLARDTAKYIYAVESTNKDVVKIALTTPDSTKIDAKIVDITNVSGNSYTVKGSDVSVSSTTLTITLGSKYVEMTGALSLTGYKFYSKNTCASDEEIKSNLTIQETTLTVYAKKDGDSGYTTIELSTTDGQKIDATVTATTETGKKTDVSNAEIAVGNDGKVTLTLEAN